MYCCCCCCCCCCCGRRRRRRRRRRGCCCCCSSSWFWSCSCSCGCGGGGGGCCCCCCGCGCRCCRCFARSVAVRGGLLNIKKLERGWGGGRSALPPSALAGGLTLCCRRLVLVLVVVAAVVVFARSVAVRGGNLKNREAGGGMGGGRSACPAVHSLVDWHSFGCSGVSSAPCGSCCCFSVSLLGPVVVVVVLQKSRPVIAQEKPGIVFPQRWFQKVPAKGARCPRRALCTRKGRYVPAKGAYRYPRRALRYLLLGAWCSWASGTEGVKKTGTRGQKNRSGVKKQGQGSTKTGSPLALSLPLSLLPQ